MTAFDNGITVVTAQRTQARYIRYIYARTKLNDEIDAWSTPKLFVWNEWVYRLAEEIMWSGYLSPVGQRKLLSVGQEQLIWEQIIAEHTGPMSIDNLAGTAMRSRQAWSLIQAWRLPDPKTAKFPNHDVTQFSTWMRAYFAKMSKRRWLDQARLIDSVAPAVRAGAIVPPNQVLLYGFTQFTPQQRVLLKHLEDAGTQFVSIKQKRKSADLKRISFGDHRQELEAAARWVRRGLSQKTPGVMAVLVPDLERNLAKVHRTFDDILSPGSSLPSSSLVGRPYSVSIDFPYGSYKLIEAAQLILRCTLQAVSFSDVSSFLRSPFVRGAGAEQPLRARFELWLRRNNIDNIASGELIKLLESFAQRDDADATNSVLSASLSSLQPVLAKANGIQAAQYWASLCREILNIVGWPGDNTPTVIEHQAAETFKDALNELGELDQIAPKCDANTALKYLRRIVRATSFRPNLSETAVQIMQPEEAFGLRFDQVWASGWHSQNWPPAPAVNPFLPIEWQRNNQLPGSTSNLQLDFALRITEDVCGSGNSVVFSHPLTNNEEELGEPPLIMKVPAKLYEDQEQDGATDYCEQIRAGTDLVQLSDYQGPQLGDVHLSRGGSSIFKLQSHCQFKAFAELRLGAVGWVVPRPGLTSLEKGNHLHKALEFLWSKINDSEMLTELSDTEHLENQVYREVELALNYHDRKRVRRLAEPVRLLEQQRLVRQVMDILKLEHQRAPFEVVGHEVQHKVRVGPLTVEARIDRVDHVPDHGLVLFDYKLGEYKVKSWKMPRMEEPQLPLYTMAYDQPVSGIAFINGKRGATSIQGVSSAEGIGGQIKLLNKPVLKGEDRNWNEQLEAWKGELEVLAADYVEGKASVNPKTKYSCSFCDLKSFCRVNLRRLKDASDYDN